LQPNRRANAIRHLRDMVIEDEGGKIIIWDQMTPRAVRDLHTDRRQTVPDFWERKGSPLRELDLPALLVARGTRGTSKESRRFQANGGHPWAPNEPHVDYHPLEKIYIRHLLDFDGFLTDDTDEWDGCPF
jgi:hypothetical protein